MDIDPSEFEKVVEHNPTIGEFFHAPQARLMAGSNKETLNMLGDKWKKNMRKNVKLYPRNPLVRDACNGIGLNKAIVCIGAGPSFNLNKKFLRDLCHWNAQWPFEHQPFIFMASNHQFKPCLEYGIIPHFTMILDAGEYLIDQLCKDIPQTARGTILLASFRVDNALLREWVRQGRVLNLFVLRSKPLNEFLVKESGDERLGQYVAVPGGNVLNQMYVIGRGYFQSTVFITVGNDLSFEYNPVVEKRRESYYADGDYSSNITSGRDEAAGSYPWMGYEISESSIMPGNYIFKYTPKATTGQLVIYKTWMEVRCGLEEANGNPFHYFNCSESGIMGVMSKSQKDEAWNTHLINPLDDLMEKDNWYLLDELFPKTFHTRTLKQAADVFLAARRQYYGEGQSLPMQIVQ